MSNTSSLDIEFPTRKIWMGCDGKYDGEVEEEEEIVG
jgi:hypothetical protein